MKFCNIHDVAEAAGRRGARKEVRGGWNSELLSAQVDEAQEASNSSCIKFDCEILARAPRVSDGVQSKILMSALEKS